MDDSYDPSLPHAKIICEHLDALVRREIQNLAIFMPPQNGKSFHFSQMFPAYALGVTDGKALVATASYAVDLARKNSRAARALVRDERYPFPNVKMSNDSTSAEEWYVTAGGGVRAVGRGGGLTGFGATIIGVDDPFNGPLEANSALIRDQAWEWWQTVVSTRQRAGCQMMLAQTRWHDDDLAGRILNSPASKNWTVLNLRAYAEEDDPLGRAVGEPLWPTGPKILSVADGEISSRSFAALYQQRPVADEGDLFKAHWFLNRYDNEPPAKRGCMFVDGAWKEGIANDRSAFGIWSTDSLNYHLRHAWGARVEYPDLKQKVIDTYAAWKPKIPNLTLCVEDAASGMALVQELRRSTSIPVIGVPAKGSKEARAEAITPLFESGKVFLPREAEWLDVWIDEHLRFPAGKHDDFVDTTSGALARLVQNSFMYVGPVDGLDVEADEPSRYHIEDIEV